MNTYELIGYAASLLVALSSMMTSILRLRLFNLLGSLVFAVYGYLIQAYPVALVNLFIAFVQLYHIVRMMRTREYFTIVNVSPDSDYLNFFLQHNLADIRKFVPDYSYQRLPNQVTLFVVRDLQPAGLLIGEQQADGTLLVHLDYVIPGYRDLKIGNYLLTERMDYFRERGIRRISTHGGSRAHADYLRRIGFTEESPDYFSRQVA